MYFLHSGFLSKFRLPWKTALSWNFSLCRNIFYHSGFLSSLRFPWKQSLPWKFSSPGGRPLHPTPRLVRLWTGAQKRKPAVTVMVTAEKAQKDLMVLAELSRLKFFAAKLSSLRAFWTSPRCFWQVWKVSLLHTWQTAREGMSAAVGNKIKIFQKTLPAFHVLLSLCYFWKIGWWRDFVVTRISMENRKLRRPTLQWLN